MHNAKKDILALILAIVGLGVAVRFFYYFPDQSSQSHSKNSQIKLFNPIKRGMQIAQQTCSPCHDMTKERKITRKGPPLWGLFGQPAGGVREFDYSLGYMEIADTGLIWNEETLDDYLKNPQKVVPGDTSNFVGLLVDTERAALIMYLKSLRDKIDPMDQPVFNQFSRPVGHTESPESPALQSKRGRIIAEQCGACHDLTREKKNIIGPYLWNIINRQAGSIETFTYSQPFLQTTKQTLRWTPLNLENFLKSPQTFIKDTRMLFSGIKDDRQRADLIAFLHTLQ